MRVRVHVRMYTRTINTSKHTFTEHFTKLNNFLNEQNTSGKVECRQPHIILIKGEP